MAPCPLSEEVVASYRAIGNQRRPIVFSDVSASPGRNAARSESITVHFVRHGQGYHNVANDAWKAGGKKGIRPIARDAGREDLMDAVLTEQGLGEAVALHPLLAQTAPTLCVVSPMQRASKTLMVGYGRCTVSGDKGLSEVPTSAEAEWKMHELCRETFMDQYICDRRRPRSVIEDELRPFVSDFLWHPESEETDALYERAESPAQAAERCYRFLLWLAMSGHKEIAVGSHSHILFMMMNAVLQTEDEALRSWFHTGEMRTVQLSWEGDLAAEVARVEDCPLQELSTATAGAADFKAASL